MAWIEDSSQRVLFVRQITGLKLWTLPGGKVKRGESLRHPHLIRTQHRSPAFQSLCDSQTADRLFDRFLSREQADPQQVLHRR